MAQPTSSTFTFGNFPVAFVFPEHPKYASDQEEEDFSVEDAKYDEEFLKIQKEIMLKLYQKKLFKTVLRGEIYTGKR